MGDAFEARIARWTTQVDFRTLVGIMVAAKVVGRHPGSERMSRLISRCRIRAGTGLAPFVDPSGQMLAGMFPSPDKSGAFRAEAQLLAANDDCLPVLPVHFRRPFLAGRAHAGRKPGFPLPRLEVVEVAGVVA